ncbi:MAG: hypothetical protein AVDCRST_MAG56-5357 [uncultured Cytophagales bacterium]|uniref:Uncharacterized protein n=1 Tax=uncultured Cytophagales bacterium TaxID=158755 RepID=A0A6J4KAN1_9SPHI|nr:MAG: hypothetical protein AVDCRST_MAG56-5357 [uncultured Cytophagales bacterium]
MENGQLGPGNCSTFYGPGLFFTVRQARFRQNFQLSIFHYQLVK